MTDSKSKNAQSEKMRFEEAFEKLESTVETLEKGELMLDDALKAFEEGMKLIKVCSERLNDAETRLQKLIETEDGEFRLEAME